MRRLAIILALGILVAPLESHAQQPTIVPRIGVLVGSSASFTAPSVEAFRQGLRELGYAEGQNITIEYRYAEGRAERLHDLAAELVRLKVDVIVTLGTPATQAAKHASTTIPIVIAIVADPVGTGLVSSLARPGGNITGSAILFPELIAKRVELLKEAIPGLTRVAVLANTANPGTALALKEIEGSGQPLGVELQPVAVRGPIEFDIAFVAITKKRAGALLVLEDGMIHTHARRIADLAAKRRLPTIFGPGELAATGGLMAYGPGLPDSFRRAASYVDKILKGAKPADLPVEQPTKFELVINLKTAKALGLTIPQSVLIRADQVIQ